MSISYTLESLQRYETQSIQVRLEKLGWYWPHTVAGKWPDLVAVGFNSLELSPHSSFDRP